MSEENYSSLSSQNSPKGPNTFSNFATPTTPISSPSSFPGSSSGSVIDFDSDGLSHILSEGSYNYYDSDSDMSVSLGTIFTEKELGFIDTTVQAVCSLTVSQTTKVVICDGLLDIGIFELNAKSGNNGMNVFHEILTRVVMKVQRCISRLFPNESRTKCYYPIDNMVEISVILIHLSNFCAKSTSDYMDPCNDRRIEFEKFEKTLAFLSRLLNTLSAHMNKINIDCVRKSDFPQLPFYRFIVGFLKDLVHDPGLVYTTSEIVSTFCILLHDISPKSIPAFAYQWLSIIGSGEFLGQVLNSGHTELEVLYSHHLLLLLEYLRPLLTSKQLCRSRCIIEYYFGVTRLFFLIHHDFPNFFVRHGFQFIEFVPTVNIQLRCIILSTIPTYICPTSPFTMGAFIPSCLDHFEMDLKNFENNAEFDYHEWCLSQFGILGSLNRYLEKREPMTFLLQLPSQLVFVTALHPDAPRHWREAEMRAVICFTASAHIRNLNWSWDSLPTFENLGDSPYMDVYQILALALDDSGRALFFNLLVDRLRYPSVETYYFFMVMAKLFTMLKNQIVKEQLITALLQRILAHPPHQWGVLAAFTELIQNPIFNFWTQPFLKRNSATKLLFDTVSRSWRVPSTTTTSLTRT